MKHNKNYSYLMVMVAIGISTVNLHGVITREEVDNKEIFSDTATNLEVTYNFDTLKHSIRSTSEEAMSYKRLNAIKEHYGLTVDECDNSKRFVETLFSKLSNLHKEQQPKPAVLPKSSIWSQ